MVSPAAPTAAPDPVRLLRRLAACCEAEWDAPGLSAWHDAALRAAYEAQNLLTRYFPEADGTDD